MKGLEQFGTLKPTCQWMDGISPDRSISRSPGGDKKLGQLLSTRVIGLIGSTWVYFGVLGSTWINLGLLGSTWVYFGLLGSTWINLGLLGQLGSTWVYLVQLGSAWDQMKGLEQF